MRWMGVALLGAAAGCASAPPRSVVAPPVPAPPPTQARAPAPPDAQPPPDGFPLPAAEPAPAAEPDALVIARLVLEARAPRIRAPEREAVARLLWEAAVRDGLPVLTVLGLIEQESRFDPRARGPRGSLGLMQLRPFVAADVAARHGQPWAGARTLFDPVANVRLGLTYLAEQRERFGDPHLAIAAYNVGPTRLMRLLAAGKGRNGPYLRRVLRRVEALVSEFEPPDAASAGGG